MQNAMHGSLELVPMVCRVWARTAWGMTKGPGVAKMPPA